LEETAMKSRISAVVVLAAVCGVSAFAWIGCSEEEKKKNVVAASCDISDPLDPPVTCGPALEGDEPCSSTKNYDTCPGGPCMAAVEQTAATKNFRMGRIRLWSPNSLVSLAAIAVDPNVNPKCANNGAESFTWLMQIDSAAKTIKTGGARASADGKTFGFLDESVNTASLESICPGFKGPSEPVNLRPVTAPYTETNGKISTDSIPLINVPIFDTSGLPIILPLREAALKNVTIEGSCIGKWEKQFACSGTTLGWTTGGAILAKITAEEADKVPVKSAGCQSLCAILANDATKTDGKVCKKGPDGKVPEIGTHCVGGTSCKNAFLLSATFGAYGIDIKTVAAPPMDAGTDTGTADTGTTADAPADGG